MSKVSQTRAVKTALLGLICALPVAAATVALMPNEATAYSKRVENACKNDYNRHCPHYKARTPQMRSCMQLAGRRGNLSPRCIDALTDAGMVPKKYRKKR